MVPLRAHSAIADERRPPIHPDPEALRRRRPRDDERGAELSGARLRPRASVRRRPDSRGRLRHRHDDQPAARARRARRLHRAEPELRRPGARDARGQRARRHSRLPPRGVQPRRTAGGGLRHRRLRQRARAHRRRRPGPGAVSRGCRGQRRPRADLRPRDPAHLRPSRRGARAPPPVLQADAARGVHRRRPRRRLDALYEPTRPARLDVQPVRHRKHGAHERTSASLRSVRRPLGAAARARVRAADRTLAVRRRPRASAFRMTRSGSTLARAAQLVPRDPLLSVVMPVYNERHTIEEIIRRVLAVPIRIQLIVVDDVSTDGTSEILERLQKELGFTLLKQPRNAGKGAALRRGFTEVSGDLMIIQDADLEYHPEEYPLLTSLITSGRADVVFGSRCLGTHRVFLLTHYLGNRLLTFITNLLYNTMLTDMETCYKVMRIDVLRSMELKSNGFGIEPEITAKVFKRRYKVYEVPISYDGRGYEEGKKITWRDGVVALWVLLKYRFTE